MNNNILKLLILAIAILIAGILIINQQAADETAAPAEQPLGADAVDSITTSGLTPLDVTYEHTAPGEYSEIFTSLIAPPGAEVTITLFGPDDAEPIIKTAIADDNGTVFVPFRIYQFGHYDVQARSDLWPTQYNSGITVE